MKITVIGSGYVGLVSGACLSELGHDVLCLDLDTKKIALLQSGVVTIFEPGLENLIKNNMNNGRLRFTTNVEESVSHGLVQMIAVGTPSDENGSADMQYVVNAARSIGRYMSEYKVIVDKSTVPVGTSEKVKKAINEELGKRNMVTKFSVVSNPEFLKEGDAIDDFSHPDRIVIGAEDNQSIDIMREMYKSFQTKHNALIIMDIKSAELTKYAANAMLATRISFMNELANLAELVGADIDHVHKGIGSDKRIGYDYLYAGCGYGGSCLPKDVRALQKTGQDYGFPLKILSAVEQVNEVQKYLLLNKIIERFENELTGKHFAIWGLAFKSGTDDMREAVSHVILKGLWACGSTISAYDPVAMNESKYIYGERADLIYANSAQDTLKNADALIILTDWKGFKKYNFQRDKSKFKNLIIFDGRNLYKLSDKELLGFEYFSIGRNN
jgi:UDPglucose 6-dehydrogenase